MSLFTHSFRTDRPQLHAGIGVDTVINTAVAGDEASQHLAVGGIYDRVTAQGGDIAPPKINIILNGLQISKFGDSLSSDFLLQISILYRQEFFADRIGHTEVK